MSKVNEISVGDILYRWVEMSGIWKYKVIAKKFAEYGNFLEIESLQCNHGFNCQLLITDGDYGKLVYVHMLNHDDEDDQRAWHGDFNRKYHFFVNEADAKKEAYVVYISQYKESVQNLKDRLAQEEKNLLKFETLLKDLM